MQIKTCQPLKLCLVCPAFSVSLRLKTILFEPGKKIPPPKKKPNLNLKCIYKISGEIWGSFFCLFWFLILLGGREKWGKKQNKKTPLILNVIYCV